ncbi:MAG: acyl-[acyl-carrier-protein]--UDP-N-acetylglucosamine O-acyltransferase [Nitrospirae bacterium GWD2_57_9]|nr:MAG: acyl-[acyl-carrier-protein]--UDP-N-acetylglucosamine O-acyltransferase [Nitrospirae bacterium GWD2_57_9]OGW49790.1 MAG: acyl-[acyl-carrier-protein]--UDP-N-acetylglucosamine O-acyltransferase [Nitrospirae bacterium GWC2_57_9]
MNIHPTAIIHKNARIAESVEIGPYAVIGEHVSIGRDTKIASHVLIEGWTTIGERNRIFSFSSIGTPPQDIGYNNEETYLIVGDENVIRECATVHRATTKADRKTEIGNRNYLMAYSHVAHDCKLGNNIIMANSAGLAGHIVIEDHAILGGIVGVHQHVRIGAYAMIGGQSAIVQDIPPYVSAAGNRAQLYGLNTIGLKRRGFSDAMINDLKKAYKIIFRSGMTIEDAFKKVAEEIPDSAQVKYFVDFMRSSKRGVTR